MTREYAPFLANADDIIFLFDPTQPDFNALSAARLVDLVNRVATSRKQKNLIVALSKMDELRAHDGWAETIGSLWPDDPPSLSALPAYFQQIDNLSQMLHLWWADPERKAQNLINSLPPTTRFCAMSSLGHQPVKDENGILRLTRKPEPFCVRDPLFWIFRAAGVM